MKFICKFHWNCYLQHMLKNDDPLEFIEAASATVEELLARIPGVYLETDNPSMSSPDIGLDLLITVSGADIHDQPTIIGIECKSSGQPRTIKKALEHLQDWADRRKKRVPLLVAPYLPPDSRRLLIEAGCNYADLAGNARIQFEQVYIERESATVPKQIGRELRSIFMPKSALVLRALLGQVGRKWKLADLTVETGVSLGQLSNVLKALEQRDWMERKSGSNVLTNPEPLIDEWATSYAGLQGVTRQYYTTMSGKKLDSMLRGVLHYDHGSARNLVLSSYSAANWISPFARQAATYLLAQRAGIKALEERLALQRVEKGGNVFVTVSDDPGTFYGSFEPAPGIFTTSPLQTYLDLLTSGERGHEAAQHLRETTSLWQPA